MLYYKLFYLCISICNKLTYLLTYTMYKKYYQHFNMQYMFVSSNACKNMSGSVKEFLCSLINKYT